MNCRIITNNGNKACMFSYRNGTHDITINGVTFKHLTNEEYFYFINNF